VRSRGLGNNSKPLQHLPHYLLSNDGHQLTELKAKHNNLVAELNSLLIQPESEFGTDGKNKKEIKIAEVKKDIAETERLIDKEKSRQSEKGNSERPDWVECSLCGKNFNKNIIDC